MPARRLGLGGLFLHRVSRDRRWYWRLRRGELRLRVVDRLLVLQLPCGLSLLRAGERVLRGRDRRLRLCRTTTRRSGRRSRTRSDSRSASSRRRRSCDSRAFRCVRRTSLDRACSGSPGRRGLRSTSLRVVARLQRRHRRLRLVEARLRRRQRRCAPSRPDVCAWSICCWYFVTLWPQTAARG